MNKQRNPDVDWGFHATIPRLVRTEYKDLTPVQKWLYVCLKDLCGDHGTCYRTLRVLAEETGISTGMLSESIRKLHEARLIHAEKKKRYNTSSKEVWHITIVDVWSANAKAHPTKRSQNEHSQENVHTVNNNVHRMNDEGVECSADEQKRSLCETEVITLSNNNIEVITDKDISCDDATAHHAHSSSEHETSPQTETPSQQHTPAIVDNSQASGDVLIATTTPQGSASVDMPIRNTESLFSDMPPAPDKTKQNGKGTQAETPPPKPKSKINPEEQAFKNAWDASEGIITPPTKGIWVAIKTLRGYEATVELVTEAVAIMRSEKYWQERGVTLEDAARNYGKYGSLAQQHKKKANEPKPRPAALSPEHISNERKRKLLENTATQRAEMDAHKAARLAQARGE